MAFEDVKDITVRQYLQQQADAKAREAEAQQRNKNMQIAAGVGDIVGAMANSSTPQQAYFNRWETMGAVPQTTKTQGISVNLDPIRQAGERGVQEAKENASRATQDFMTEQKVTDMGRQRQAEDQAAQAARDRNDPASAVSVAARQMLKMLAPNTSDDQLASLSAAQIEKISPDIVKASEARINREFQASQTQANQAFQASQNALNRAASRENAALAAEDRRAAREAQAAKVKEPTASERDAASKAQLALTGVQGMAQALANGDNTFSVWGDNDFTRNRRYFEEGLGRLMSGGAITKDEEDRFKAMAPTFKDKPATRAAKLEELSNQLKRKLASTGVAPAPSATPQTASSGPHGQTVEQDGVVYYWNGSDYVER